MSATVQEGMLPRRGNALSRGFAHIVLRIMGWRLEIALPNTPKAMIILAPHTSNWDFVFGLATLVALGLRVEWLAKHTMFQGPFGGVFRWLGGIPLDRSNPQGAVVQAVHAFRQRGHLVLALAPEGTRRRVDGWKRGFYVIASQAGVPIIPAYADYARRVVGIFPLLLPSGDETADLARLRELYLPVHPRHPELWNPDWQ